jgi:hypothetical protein
VFETCWGVFTWCSWDCCKMLYIKVAFLLLSLNHRIIGWVVIIWFYCSFVTWSRWVFAYLTRCVSSDSWLLLLMIGFLLKQSIDALILVSYTLLPIRAVKLYLPLVGAIQQLYCVLPLQLHVYVYYRCVCIMCARDHSCGMCTMYKEVSMWLWLHTLYYRLNSWINSIYLLISV